jgi:hypothetical protein
MTNTRAGETQSVTSAPKIAERRAQVLELTENDYREAIDMTGISEALSPGQRRWAALTHRAWLDRLVHSPAD